MKNLKEIARQTANIIIGFTVLGILLPALAFMVGIVIKLIIYAFKFGYQLW